MYYGPFYFGNNAYQGENILPMKPKYMGYIQPGLQSKLTDTPEEARSWISTQLDAKASVIEGFLLETVERIYKASPPLESEKISGQADRTPAVDPEDLSYSNSKFDGQNSGYVSKEDVNKVCG